MLPLSKHASTIGGAALPSRPRRRFALTRSPIMSVHTTATKPTDSRKTIPSPRRSARKSRPKKAAPGASGQRDAYSRFQAGNPGGFGNPYARQVAMLRRELMQRARPEEIREIGDKLLALAKGGNVPAAKVILSYTLGVPTPAQQPD